MTWAPGTRLGPYELTSPIGKGGMGEVWKAQDTRLNRTVAIKRMTERYSARFEQEARAIAALNHPHICTLYDVGPDYLVMEYIDGTPLKGPLAPDEALKLARQMAGALEAAHAKGILHRDLKPGNVLVTASGVKLLDFGLAKLIEDADATLTLEGTIAGTAAYMSPEQARGEQVDARSDIFSFGSVLYELLSGRRAFSGASTSETLSAVLRDEPRTADGPAELVQLVRKCLRKAREERFASATEVCAALEQVRLDTKQQPSIAVLPFADMSPGKDQEYFSDGLAEEIISVLSRIQGLKVIARTSAFAFKGKQEDIRRIGEALGVSSILEGSVRKAGNRLRITAQLVSARDGGHLWSDRYDREMEDVFAVQDEIAQAIAGALQVHFTDKAPASPRYSPKLEAYEALLRARHQMQQWTPESLTRGRNLYAQAIEIDPKYGLARCELGFSYFGLATEHEVPPREAAAKMSTLAYEALAIDRHLAEAHALLATAAMMDYQWEAADHHFRQAFAGAPINMMVSICYGYFFLPAVGRHQEGIAHMNLALSQDPLNVAYRNGAGILRVALDDPDGARILEQALEEEPNDWIAALILAQWHVWHGDPERALYFAERAYAVVPRQHGAVGLLAALLRARGEEQRSAPLLEYLGDGAAGGAPTGWVYYYLTRGELAQAAEWLGKAIDQYDTRTAFIGVGTWGSTFISTPYWPPLARKMNLPVEAA